MKCATQIAHKVVIFGRKDTQVFCLLFFLTAKGNHFFNFSDMRRNYSHTEELATTSQAFGTI